MRWCMFTLYRSYCDDDATFYYDLQKTGPLTTWLKKKKDATLRRRTTSWSDVQSEPSKSSLSWCGPQQVTVQDLLDLVLIMGFLPRTASPLVRVWRRCCPRLLNWTTLWPKSQVLDTNAATYRPVFYILFFLAAFWHEFKVKLKKTPKKPVHILVWYYELNSNHPVTWMGFWANCLACDATSFG